MQSPSMDQIAAANTVMIQSLRGLDRKGVQALMESSQFKSGLSRLVQKWSCYSDEEVETDLGYPKAYTGNRPLRDQITELADCFHVDPTEAFEMMQIAGDKPEHAEGWFAWLDWRVLKADSYYWACQEVFRQIRKHSVDKDGTTLFSEIISGGNQFEWDFTDRYKRGQFNHCSRNRGPIRIAPAQLGKGRAGQSHRRANMLCHQTKHEYPLGLFEVACIALLHPERLGPSDELGGGAYLSMLAPGSVKVDPLCETGYSWESGLDPHSQHQYFQMHAYIDAAVVSDYGRVACHYSHSGKPDLRTAGPVTAWTWQPHKK